MVGFLLSSDPMVCLKVANAANQGWAIQYQNITVLRIVLFSLSILSQWQNIVLLLYNYYNNAVENDTTLSLT